MNTLFKAPGYLRFLALFLFFIFPSLGKAQTPDIDWDFIDVVSDQIIEGEGLPDRTIGILQNLSLFEKEAIIEQIAAQLDEEEVKSIRTDMLQISDPGAPTRDGYGRVSYYYRYLVYDRNEGDYDYIYVFRLNTMQCPYYYEHWYRSRWWCPAMYRIWGTYWSSYVQSGSLYYEFLFGKGTVDAMTCYGYLEMAYWN